MNESLEEKWIRSGLKPGDTILLHSDIGRTIIEYNRITKKRIGPKDLLESFINIIGVKGTLVLPTFNFDFIKGKTFDIQKTPSQMGVLSELCRLNPHSVRTGHPVYSFSVIGHNKNYFKGVNNVNAFGEDSPFGILKSMNGKIAVLDLEDSDSMTFYHHIEEINQVDYRYHKKFTGFYVDQDGIKSKRIYNIFVRNLEKGVLSNANPAGELLWKKNLYYGHRPMSDTGLRIIESKKMFDFVSKIITKNKALGHLYTLGHQK